MDVWYSLKLPPAFSYYAVGYLNDNLTHNISVSRLQRYTFYAHILHTITKHDKSVPNYKKVQKQFHRTSYTDSSA